MRRELEGRMEHPSTPKRSAPKCSAPKPSTPKRSTPKSSTPKPSTPKPSTPKHARGELKETCDRPPSTLKRARTRAASFPSLTAPGGLTEGVTEEWSGDLSGGLSGGLSPSLGHAGPSLVKREERGRKATKNEGQVSDCGGGEESRVERSRVESVYFTRSIARRSRVQQSSRRSPYFDTPILI